MKKITMILVALMLTITGFSQSVNKVSKAQYLVYEGGTWITKTSKRPSNMFVILDKDNVSITNEARSRYVTYGEPEKVTYETFVCYTWSCVDSKGKDCSFLLKNFPDNSSIMIISYAAEGYAFEYFTDPN
jgi:hypothetical protein